MLDDITIDEQYLAVNKRRMDYFIPNYLCNHIKGEKICSMGCGTGYDVELLNKLGYDAWGVDPGSRISDWQNRPADIQNKLLAGFAHDFPLGNQTFDFVYALEVIEHVGCKDGGWQLEPDNAQIRKDFIASCLDMLKPGGRLLLSTSNRLFPIDVGHAHHYHPLTNAMAEKGLNLTIPWHKRNFVLSFQDIARLVNMCEHPEQYKIRQLSSYRYPSNSGGKYGNLFSMFRNGLLLSLSFYPLIRYNPILVVVIEKS